MEGDGFEGRAAIRREYHGEVGHVGRDGGDPLVHGEREREAVKRLVKQPGPCRAGVRMQRIKVPLHIPIDVTLGARARSQQPEPHVARYLGHGKIVTRQNRSGVSVNFWCGFEWNFV